MLVREISDLFYAYCNEADRTFLTTGFQGTGAATYLKQAYDAFRVMLTGIDETLFRESATITFVNVQEVDLSVGAVRLLGATPTQATLRRLLNIYSVNPTTGVQNFPYQATSSQTELTSQIGPYASVGAGMTIFPFYLFTGSKIVFGRLWSDTMQVLYDPFPSKPENPTGIDWTKQLPADNEFVDNFGQFHEWIALDACRRYAIRDRKWNEQLMDAHARMTMDIKTFFERGRDVGAGRTVLMVY